MHENYERLNNANLLWHYTGWEGLSGIVESDSLYASNYASLNDEQELVYAFQPFWEAAKVGGEETARHLAGETCVASLSRRFDSLSQWRAYSSAPGIAVGFNRERLTAAVSECKGQAELVRCEYDPDVRTRLISPLVETIRKARQWEEESSRKDPEGSPERYFAQKAPWHAIQNAFSEIMRVALRIKHPSFVDEEEERIIYWGGVSRHREDREDDWPPSRSFRRKASVVIPHVHITLNAPGQPTPIEGILIGPNPHPQLNELSVKRLLQLKWDHVFREGGEAHRPGANSFRSIPVATTEIPFRSW